MLQTRVCQRAHRETHFEKNRRTEHMTDQRMTLFQQLGEAVLTTAGEIPTSLRTALTWQTALLCNDVPQVQTPLPPELIDYVQKVARHAYQVTNQDIEQLQAHGYSEDAIFEVTVSVAYGAGLNCLEQGLAALQGARNAIEEH
jgi:alkylhydroperoxidase family enzyme